MHLQKLRHFAKTDKLGSKLLEKYAEFVKDEVLLSLNLSKEELELQALRSVERDLEQVLHSWQCRAKLLNGKALDYTDEQIDFIKKQLVEVQKDIEKLVFNNQDLQKRQNILTSYKGVGKKIANSLIAEMPELGTLSNKEAASLAGVAPKTIESGKKVGKGHITGERFLLEKHYIWQL